jgi:hypothetical protein
MHPAVLTVEQQKVLYLFKGSENDLQQGHDLA